MLRDIACVRMSECVSLCVLLSPTHSCALTAARAGVSPSGRDGNRMEARASLRPLQQRNDTHHKQRTDQRRDHVVLRVPFIALPTEPGDALSRCDYFRNDALNNFKATADREDNRCGQRQTPDSAPNSAKP